MRCNHEDVQRHTGTEVILLIFDARAVIQLGKGHRNLRTGQGELAITFRGSSVAAAGKAYSTGGVVLGLPFDPFGLLEMGSPNKRFSVKEENSWTSSYETTSSL